MRSDIFIKQSIGLNPLASSRDWRLFVGIFAGFVIIQVLVARLLGLNPYELRSGLISATIGILLPLINYLPVRGYVCAFRTIGILAEIAKMGFDYAGERDAF